MNYIIFDLEWNQGSPEKTVSNPAIPFEIVEIGAVKYNSDMEYVDSFHELVRPQVYREIHRITGQIIHLNMEELQKGRSFCEAAEAFLYWCGEDEYRFCSWGPSDLTELQRNMRYYGMEPLSDGPIPFLDVQKLFSIACEDRKTRRALEAAIDHLQIRKDIPFHRADSDAYYTAKVLAGIYSQELLRNVSYDIFNPPKDRKSEVKVQFDTYTKYISRTFESREKAFADREVVSCKCYLCRCNLKKRIKWFTINTRHYYCVAYCERHGWLKGKIRVNKTEDGKVYIVKTTKFINEDEMKRIEERKEHARELRRRHHAKQNQNRITQ